MVDTFLKFLAEHEITCTAQKSKLLDFRCQALGPMELVVDGRMQDIQFLATEGEVGDYRGGRDD